MAPTVLITGAAQRIGKALAIDFAKQGYNVGIHYLHSHEMAQSVAKEIETLGQEAFLIKADLSKICEVENIFPAFLKQVESVSVLINNASTFKYDNIHSATPQSWDYHLDPNLRAAFLLSQAFAKQNAKGLIINIIDQRVWNLTPHYLTYTLSKYGLWGLTQTLALALAPYTRVNAIGPGPILKNKNQTDEQFLKQCQATPLQRGGNLKDICAAAQFFCQAESVTGQMIAVDGGQHLGWSIPAVDTEKED